MAYTERFVLMLPLRECARRCRICLKTAYTTRHRLIEGLSAYPPPRSRSSGTAAANSTRPISPSRSRATTRRRHSRYRPPRHRGKQVYRRRLSREQICVMTVANDSNETFFEVSGRGVLSRKHAVDVLRGHIASGSVVTTDKASAYVDALAELEVAVHAACNSKDRSEGTINRINTVHSLLGAFMEPFRGVSMKHLDAYLA